MMAERVVIAAFEPFAGRRTNRALLVGRRIAGEELAVLPVAFAALADPIRQLVARSQRRRAAAILLLGEARRELSIRVERVALNLVDAPILDNQGNRPRGCPVVAEAPLAYLATAPCATLVEASRRVGAPAELSLSAGRFVCNAAFFRTLHELAGGAPSPRRPAVAFVHVPAARGAPSIERLAQAVRSMLAVWLGPVERSPDRRPTAKTFDAARRSH